LESGSKLPHSKEFASSGEARKGNCSVSPTTDINQSERIESAFRRAGSGDADAFAEWMGMVEYPMRRSLAAFARAVDVEVVVQESFLRMWLIACDPARCLEGENASLKFALGLARNVALEELRRTRIYQYIDDKSSDALPEICIAPEFPDPALRRAIHECLDRLPAKPKTALRARIQDGDLPDRDLAQDAGMKLNTFLQNIVRARKFMARCLENKGVKLDGVLS
jgi:DNA-directed RNA polymerase specialized sigma24 family protein